MAQPLALVVGFDPGVGTGIARAFQAAGFRLALVSRQPDKVPAKTSLHAQFVESTRTFNADAGDSARLMAVIEQINQELGAPEVLVYNAVAFTFGKPTSLMPEQLTADLRVSVSGALAAVLGVLPAMKARGRGTLLFTGGGAALHPWVDAASISVSKAALRNLVFTLADELRGTGVRVGTVTIMGQVAPGTPFDPGKIGQAFVDLYAQPTENFTVERLFTGQD